MRLNLDKELSALSRMSIGQLRGRYTELFGDATNAKNRPWLVKRIAWRLQALAEGDLSERARRRAEELANDADLRLMRPRAAAVAPVPAALAADVGGDPRLPPPGSVLMRPYKGRTVRVHVLPRGFEFEGETYRTLSAVAKAITGSHCNGFLFFKLTKGEEA
jgi:Protein of unknown function (DUF2924)